MAKRQTPSRGAALYGAATEYALHCLLLLVRARSKPASSRDLAEMQGVPEPLLSKLMTRLKVAGLVTATSGINGGYRLALAPEEITMLAVVDAVEGRKRAFDCREVRRQCVLFDDTPPAWSTMGVCGVHAAMLRAEKAMRDELAKTTLLQLSSSIKAPASFTDSVDAWFDDRAASRERARVAAVRARPRRRPASA